MYPQVKDYLGNIIEPGDKILRPAYSEILEHTVTRVTERSIYIEQYETKWVQNPKYKPGVKGSREPRYIMEISPEPGEKRLSVDDWAHRIFNKTKIQSNDKSN